MRNEIRQNEINIEWGWGQRHRHQIYMTDYLSQNIFSLIVDPKTYNTLEALTAAAFAK